MDTGAIAASRLGEDQVVGCMITRRKFSVSIKECDFNFRGGSSWGWRGSTGCNSRNRLGTRASAYTSSLTVIVGKSWRICFDRAVPNQFAMTMHNSALLMATRYRREKSMPSKKEEPTRRIAWNVEC